MIKIVVDLLGADKPQTELVSGAIRAISENKDLYVYLMGRKAELEDFLANVNYDESQLEIVDCTQEITNYDDPVDAYHDKTDSSLIKGLKMCRMNEDIGGFVTCGATGVVLISSILILGKLNATRPALSVVLNGRNDKPFCIVDCGANIDCKADRFVDFARLGVAYMKTLGIENPTVATLSNGIEAGKGSDVIKEAHELLEKCGFNFTGNIEGKEVLDGNADVVVCDGFAGNVALKVTEGTASMLLKMISKEFKSDILGCIIGLLAKPFLRRILKKINWEVFGGMLLLGVNGISVIAHGRSSSYAMKNAVRAAVRVLNKDINSKIAENINR